MGKGQKAEVRAKRKYDVVPNVSAERLAEIKKKFPHLVRQRASNIAARMAGRGLNSRGSEASLAAAGAPRPASQLRLAARG